MRLALLWSPEGQGFARGAETFRHPGEVGTSPSHDVSHLLLAASDKLPWRPSGTRVEICFAEYNAVLLEHLLLRAVQGEAPGLAVRASLGHAAWFCREHYAPFPVEPAEALRRFREGLDLEGALRLFPFFWGVRVVELASAGARGCTFRLAFDSGDEPPASPDCEASRRLARLNLERILAAG